jgi:hypothetical protein
MSTAGTKRAPNQGAPADPGRVRVRAGSKVQPRPRLLTSVLGGSRQRAWYMAKSGRAEAAVPVFRPGDDAHAECFIASIAVACGDAAPSNGTRFVRFGGIAAVGSGRHPELG